MTYTVKKLSELSGISVRTLHYYDEIGLLKPSQVKTNGYRIYDKKEILKLQQILYYRELNFTLNEIKSIINDPNFDLEKALETHKQSLIKEQRRIKRLIKTIDKTILNIKGKLQMSDKEYFDNITQEEIEKHKDAARKEYGDFEDRTKGMSTPDFKKLLKQGESITKSLIEKMELGLNPDSTEVQEIIAEHFKYINRFWDCNNEAYGTLGKMYVEDERFTKNIDKAKEGLAKFMFEGIEVFVKRNS